MTNALLGLFYCSDTTNAVASEEVEENNTVIRSQSSDLLKKSPIDPVTKKGHFNSLKQWGKNRLKLIGRSPSASRDSFKDTTKFDKSKDVKTLVNQDVVSVSESVTMRKKRDGSEERRSHQRCASYSSSEKSIGVPAAVPNTATINSGVKLRTTSVQRRLRRSGIGKDEPHSSSGNWSASSESGRTSIGSEITSTTVPPKSTTSAATSNNSLSGHHGPPSSIISRRRFPNTSGSGSVTSEGTLTPDIIHDLHEDIETSSEFSCDTEGYYTSFHMDSGLKTLKEEDVIPSTPLHTSNALSNSSNSQTMTAENEYELFGKGSTSTTTSSAGTVCTALMAAGSDRSLVTSPTVPERKSSLTKINRSRNNTSLERNINSSFSNSPFNNMRYNSARSYAEKRISNNTSPEVNVPTSTITITNNVGREITAVAEVHTETEAESTKKSTGTSSPDSGHNTSSSPIEDSISSAHGKNSLSEQDYSESSDLEGTERIERIRYKTTINSSRIPSMCVITPTNSDDESETSNKDCEVTESKSVEKLGITEMQIIANRPKLELPTDEKSKLATNVAKPNFKPTSQINLKTLQPLSNLMCKLKGVLPQKLSNKKSPVTKEPDFIADIYDSGDYVTIADVKNNNQSLSYNKSVYGNNDIVKKNLQTVLSGKLPDTEYVSLNELPNCLNEGKDYLEHGFEDKRSPALEEIQKKGAKVTLDSQGQVIFSSDTLRRRKGAHTTFEPGPFVQEISPTTTIIQRETADIVKVIDETDFPCEKPLPSSKPTSPQLGKTIIRAPAERDGPVTTEFITLPTPKPNTIITALPVTETPTLTTHQPPKTHKTEQDLPRIVEAITRTGAYVNIHDAEGVSLSPTKDDSAGKNVCKESLTRRCLESKLSDLDATFKSDDDIIPFVPNFQTPRMLQNKSHNEITKSGSKIAEVLKMFGTRTKCIGPEDELNANVNGDDLSEKSINFKIKRSDSYKLANSPLLPIKKLLKLDSFSSNAKKVDSLEMIQAEITADLLREQINYPPTVSPKLDHINHIDQSRNTDKTKNRSYIDGSFESKLSELQFSPFATPMPKRHSMAFIPDMRDTSIDVLKAILDSEPDEICLLHSSPVCITPSKVTVPVDGSKHRARILSISESEYGTEIW